MAGFPLWILAVAVGIRPVTGNVILSSPSEMVLDSESPPYVTAPNGQDTIYLTRGYSHSLHCEALGNPTPRLEWQANGISIADHSIQMFPENGTLVFTSFDPSTEGYYQCKAANKHGVSFSQVIEVRATVFRAFSNEKKPDNKVVVAQGGGVKLECTDQPYIRPLDAYSWYDVLGIKDNKQILVDSSHRMDIDTNGSLYITQAMPEDTAVTYACGLSSGVFGTTTIARTPYVAVEVTKGNVRRFTPKLLGSTGFATADLHGTVVLECFFSGWPAPNITWWFWSKTQSRKMVSGAEARTSIKKLGHRLEISAITDDDQGNYVCEASNDVGNASATTFLNVTSRPLFKKSPQIIISPVGSDATFFCEAEGSVDDDELPVSRPAWTRNGLAGGFSTPSSWRQSSKQKYHFSADGRKLTVRDVTKADMACVQCNVTNSRGYAYGYGYLVVIDPLKVVNQPNRTLEVEPGTPEVNLTVQAMADPCCPVMFSWSVNGQVLSSTALKTPPYNYISGGNQATLTLQLPSGSRKVSQRNDSQHGLLGEYHCTVWHSAYAESGIVKVTLKWKEAKKPEQEAVKAGKANLWWLGLVGGVLVLLLAIVVIFLMVHFNYPRQAYLLDKEEKKHRLNPEKDILDHSFEEI
ncbi:hypothetical protein ACOMHN_038742 [Nucella lapillus]